MTLLPPVLVTVSGSVCCVPNTTLPNAGLDGLLVNCPSAMPVPERGTFTLESDALLAIASVALNGPAVFGENVRLKVSPCPASTVAGRLGALSEKLLLEILALLIVTAEPPRFVAVKVSVLLLPAAMLPKSTLALPSDRLPDCGVGFPLPPVLSPAQPTSDDSPRRSNNTFSAVPTLLVLLLVRRVRVGLARIIGAHRPIPMQHRDGARMMRLGEVESSVQLPSFSG